MTSRKLSPSFCMSRVRSPLAESAELDISSVILPVICRVIISAPMAGSRSSRASGGKTGTYTSISSPCVVLRSGENAAFRVLIAAMAVASWSFSMGGRWPSVAM